MRSYQAVAVIEYDDPSADKALTYVRENFVAHIPDLKSGDVYVEESRPSEDPSVIGDQCHTIYVAFTVQADTPRAAAETALAVMAGHRTDPVLSLAIDGDWSIVTDLL